MNNQENKNEEGIDFSQFQARQRKEPFIKHKGFSFDNFKQSWQRMGKKNQIFTIIIVIAFILIIVFLISLFGGRGSKEIAPGKTIPPEYAPPAEYPDREEYTPPFP